MPMPESSLVVYVVSHTHWDREWYQPAGRFRQRLVALLDELIDDPPSGGASFLLDGQAVIIDDYLDVRPERQAELRAMLSAGALEAGPWYVLGDELIPSGESMVRNLMAGRRVLAALGAPVPPVLYSPDAFGHPASLPMLAAGFGIGVVVLWRGYGGPAWPSGDAARWMAADGSGVLLYHLAPDGYELGASLPVDAAGAAARWAALRGVLGPRATLGLALLPNGADHHARQRGVSRAVAELARAAAPDVVRAGSLRAFATAIAERARGVQLPAVGGELRASYGYTWTLQGTFGVRARQKRTHRLVERLLVRDAEPWAALAARSGAATRAPLLRAAWKALLLCQPHDTLCGCSIDDVARAMDARLGDAMAQGIGVRDDALLDVIGHDRAAARDRRTEWSPVVVVRNRAARPRGGVAEMDVARVIARMRVGPGSGAGGAMPSLPPAFSLDGGSVPLQVLGRAVRHDRIESPLHYPDDALVEAAHAVAWIPPVAGYGTSSFPLDALGHETTPPSAVRASGRSMENEYLRVQVDAAGAVRVMSPAGLTVPALLALEDVGEGGDLYTHSPRGPLLRCEALGDVRLAHAGPLRATLEGTLNLDVPLALDGDARAAGLRPLLVRVALTLDAACPFLRIAVRGDNACRDHRLRLVLRTGLSGASAFADAAFGSVRREPIMAPAGSSESAPPTAPLARYVTLATPRHGATVFADGLAEYESTPRGDVAITLLRAVGELSRNTLPERPGHAGWPVPTPGAQEQGPFEAAFALLLHGPRDAATIDLIERAADDFLLPLIGVTYRDVSGTPAPTFGVELRGEGLAFSTCKASESGDFTVLRCLNLTDAPVEGSWLFTRPISEAHLSRLDESLGEPLPASGREVRFISFAHSATTILVR